MSPALVSLACGSFAGICSSTGMYSKTEAAVPLHDALSS